MKMAHRIPVDHHAAATAEVHRTGFASLAMSWETVYLYLAGHSIHLISRQQKEPHQHSAAWLDSIEEIAVCQGWRDRCFVGRLWHLEGACYL
jgi:hypothetical protein